MSHAELIEYVCISIGKVGKDNMNIVQISYDPGNYVPRVAVDRRHSYPSPAPSTAGLKTSSNMCVHSCSVQDFVAEKGIITKQSRAADLAITLTLTLRIL